MASADVARHLGESVKSSASFSFASTAFEKKSDLSSSTIWNVEIGGIGTHGIFQFLKGSVSSHLAYEVSDTVTVAVEGTLGIIIPSRVVSKSDISPCDRFHAGGIGQYGLRGFHQYGIGPMSPRRSSKFSSACKRQFDSLGGTFICSVLGALRFQMPIPTLSALGIEGQIFCNVGLLGDLGDGMTMKQKFAKENLRATLGMGLYWPLQIGQLEANICRVMNKGPRDYAKNGIQFGITPY
jgi:outer membrane protein insertion porin family